MRNALFLATAFLLVVFFTGCATYPLPITATDNPVGSKRGQASGMTYFGVFGDAGSANISSAARNGNISRIATVDFGVTNTWIMQKYTVTVTGE